MEEIVNQYWNIFDPPVIDTSTKFFKFVQYKEKNVNVKELDSYEINVINSNWKYPHGAYLFVKSKVTNDPQNYATVTNNGVNDFKKADLYYENKLIESINYPGIATTVSNLIEFSGDVSSSKASQLCWYMDTADSTEKNRYTYDTANKATKLKDIEENALTFVQNIKHNPNFNEGFLERWQLTRDGKLLTKFIPLSRIFRFCRDVKKMLNGEIKICLEKNNIKNILHAYYNGLYKYEILDLSLFIPETEPSLNVLAIFENNITKVINNKSPLTNLFGWNGINCYRSDLQNSDSGTFNIITSQYKITSVYIVFSSQDRDSNFENTQMVFDNMNLETAHIIINGTQFPVQEYQTDFTPDKLDCQRVYAAFLDIGYTSLDDGTAVSYKNYCTLYPIICFDLSKENVDSAFSGMKSDVLQFNWRLRTQPEKNYYIYAIVESERTLHVNIMNGKNIFFTP